MNEYRLTCPECGAALYARIPEAVIWERCPACRKHIWDIYDVRMADKSRITHPAHGERNSYAAN